MINRVVRVVWCAHRSRFLLFFNKIVRNSIENNCILIWIVAERVKPLPALNILDFNIFIIFFNYFQFFSIPGFEIYFAADPLVRIGLFVHLEPPYASNEKMLVQLIGIILIVFSEWQVCRWIELLIKLQKREFRRCS